MSLVVGMVGGGYSLKMLAGELKAHGRRKKTGTAKLAAIELACRLSGMTQREIGEYYGGVSSQAVSAARKRAKDLVPPEVLARLAGIIKEQPYVSP